jgi:HK97 family phage major capsid protein
MALNDLRAARERAVMKQNTEEALNDKALFDSLEAEIVELDEKIARGLKAQERAAQLAKPLNHGEAQQIDQPQPVAEEVFSLALDRALERGAAHPAQAMSDNAVAWARRFDMALRTARRNLKMTTLDRSKHFTTFGEMLQAVASASMSRHASVDARLQRAPTGAGEVDPTGGGFLVQMDFAQTIFMLAHDMGDILSRVNKLPISEKSNGIKIPGVDETSRATGSRWGGVQSYWVGEGQTPTTTKPKFRLIDFNLHKLMSLMYTTDELLQDQTALTVLASQAFSEEVMFMTEDGIFEGTGSGMPFGIMNHPSLITESAASGSGVRILKADIDNMWSRMWNRSRKNAVWLINQDCEPALLGLNEPVGSSGGVGGTLVYMPPGGMSDTPYAKLYGRPVLSVEYCNTLGTKGDIVLADLSQYTLIDKGGVQAATSMHVAFLTDEMVFRITYRVDGKPMWTKDLTPFKGSNTKSPFVALATRS